MALACRCSRAKVSSPGRRDNPAVRERSGARGGVRYAGCRCSRAMALLPDRPGNLSDRDRSGAKGEARRAAICVEDRASRAARCVDSRASRAVNPMVSAYALVRPSRAGCAAARPSREGRSGLPRSRPARPRMSSLRPPLSCASSSSSRSVPSGQGLAQLDCGCIAMDRWKQWARTPGHWLGAPLPGADGAGTLRADAASRAQWFLGAGGKQVGPGVRLGFLAQSCEPATGWSALPRWIWGEAAPSSSDRPIQLAQPLDAVIEISSVVSSTRRRPVPRQGPVERSFASVDECERHAPFMCVSGSTLSSGEWTQTVMRTLQRCCWCR